jgi:hypothetical protein
MYEHYQSASYIHSYIIEAGDSDGSEKQKSASDLQGWNENNAGSF